MIDDIAIDLWSIKILQAYDDIKRKCKSMMDLLKFTSLIKIKKNKKKNKKKSGVVTLIYN